MCWRENDESTNRGDPTERGAKINYRKQIKAGKYGCIISRKKKRKENWFS